MNAESFDRLVGEVLANTRARAAAHENALRRGLAAAFEVARAERHTSFRDLAREMQTSLSQVQRLLHEEQGGSLTLGTICRAADALDQCITLHVRPRTWEGGRVIRFGTSAGWISGERPRSSESAPRLPIPPSGVGRGRWKVLSREPRSEVDAEVV